MGGRAGRAGGLGIVPKARWALHGLHSSETRVRAAQNTAGVESRRALGTLDARGLPAAHHARARALHSKQSRIDAARALSGDDGPSPRALPIDRSEGGDFAASANAVGDGADMAVAERRATLLW